MRKVTPLVVIFTQMLAMVVLDMQFNKAGDVLHPKTAGGFVSSTAIRADCASKCFMNLRCWSFYHNPSDDTCYLASPDQVVVPDTSFPDITANRFDHFTTPTPPPTTCLDLLDLGVSVDGEYWLYPSSTGGQGVKVFCHGMRTGSPSEYISFYTDNFGDYPPECNLNCNGESTSGCPSGNVGHVEFSKIKIDMTTMNVVRTDKTFASGTGVLADYGDASDCYNTHWGSRSPPYECGPKGQFQMDLTGTNLRFNDQTTWTTSGYKTFKAVTWNNGGSTVHVLCGGWCGGCVPDFIKLEIKPLAFPKTCLEVKTCGNTNADGEYWINPTILGEANIKVYCDAMDTGTPKEYISLQNTNFGDYPPECNLNCNGEKTTGCPSGDVGHVEYSKIRIDISNMNVIRTDKTFATGTGSFADYGVIRDCYNTIWGTPSPPYACGPKGEFQIDATGTGLKFNSQSAWTAGGYKAFAAITPSGDGKVVHGLCGGWSGGCTVDFIKLDLDPTQDVPESSATVVGC